MENPAVKKAIELLGGQSATAKALGVSQPAVRKWLLKNIPPERAIELERLSGVSRKEIRPDIFEEQGKPQGAN